MLATLALSVAAQAGSFVDDFDRLWNAVDERYAYHGRPGIDWAGARERHRPDILAAQESGDRQAALATFENLLEELHDPHVHLNTNNDASPRLVPSQLDLWVEWVDAEARITAVRRDSAAALAGIAPGDRILQVRGRAIEALTAERLHLASPLDLQAVDAATIGWALRATTAGRWNEARTLKIASPHETRVFELDDAATDAPAGVLSTRTLPALPGTDVEVGYVRWNDSLGDRAAIAAFDEAIERMAEQDALILDLRGTPGGGNTTVARAILGHFVTRPTPYQRHVLVSAALETGVPRSWLEEVSPRGRRFEGRALVLVGRWTGSMGEGLALGFDALGVPVLGGPMAGLLGALTEVHLPHSGWTARFADEALTHVDGTPRETWRPAVTVGDPQPSAAEDPVLEAARTLLSKGH